MKVRYEHYILYTQPFSSLKVLIVLYLPSIQIRFPCLWLPSAEHGDFSILFSICFKFMCSV